MSDRAEKDTSGAGSGSLYEKVVDLHELRRTDPIAFICQSTPRKLSEKDWQELNATLNKRAQERNRHSRSRAFHGRPHRCFGAFS